MGRGSAGVRDKKLQILLYASSEAHYFTRQETARACDSSAFRFPNPLPARPPRLAPPPRPSSPPSLARQVTFEKDNLGRLCFPPARRADLAMELRQLRYFLAVAEHQGFRKAAQKLQISHPSLCEQIMNLEKEIGTALFDRTSQKIHLTAPGHAFLEGARRTLKAAVQTVEVTRGASQGQNGELRIGSVGLMCRALLARLIRAFRERFPKVQVSILQQNPCEKMSALLERVDLGMGYLTPESIQCVDGALTSGVIAAAPVGIAAAPTRLDEQRTATLRDFVQDPFLVLDPTHAPGYLEWARSVFVQAGFEPAKTIPVDSADGFFTLLCAGAGVALLSALHFEGQGEGVCFQKLSQPAADFPLSLAWDARRASPLVANFLGVVRQVLPVPNPTVNGALNVDGLNRPVSPGA